MASMLASSLGHTVVEYIFPGKSQSNEVIGILYWDTWSNCRQYGGDLCKPKVLELLCLAAIVDQRDSSRC